MLKRMYRTAIDCIRFIDELVFVPKCVGCGIRLGREDGNAKSAPVFCSDCMALYLEEKETECPICGSPTYLCLCPTPNLKRSGFSYLVKLFRYRPHERDSVQNELIFLLKKQKVRRVTEFIAEEIQASIEDAFPVGAKNTVVTFAPRSKKMTNFYGFDHAELIAKELSRRMQLPFLACLERDARAGVQKSLNASERMKNVKHRIRMKRGTCVDGMRVLLIDDVLTTGATLLTCAKVLKRSGASMVVPTVLGIAYKPTRPTPKSAVRYYPKGGKKAKGRKRYRYSSRY